MIFIAKALSPSEPVHVELSPSDMTATVVVPDRQLSLAIGKEGQNTRLAAKLTGWRLDIKGLTEWEEVREERLKQAQQQAALVSESEAAEEVEEVAAVIAEAELVAAQAEDAAAVAEEVTADEAPVLEATTVETKAPEAATVSPAEVVADEDKILEALIREEEEAPQEAKAEVLEEPSASFSVDDLESFTLDDIDIDAEDLDGEGEEEAAVDLEPLPEILVLTPDAGKIRFAEDIVDESRGGGRRERKGRRSSGAGSRGARRGGR